MAEYTELPWLYAGLLAYVAATILATWGVVQTKGQVLPKGEAMRGHERLVLGLVVAGVLLLTMALTERWLRIGHGPFVNLIELLMSQLFSLGLIFSIAYWRLPQIRPSAFVVLALMWVLGVWAVNLDAVGGPLPPTYYNSWLWAHVGFGKVFLSFCLIGTGLAGLILLRGNDYCARMLARAPDDAVLDSLAWRFMMGAFIFHTLMLMGGAVWAQDAWGRYWAWDALETSSFLNWLMLGAAIHARVSYKVPRRVGAGIIVVIFVFAFFTYFGTPFYSIAAHKGVI